MCDRGIRDMEKLGINQNLNILLSQNKKPSSFRDEKGFRGTTLFDGFRFLNGPKGTRTLDLYNAIVALSQLSYRPKNYSSGLYCKQGVGAIPKQWT